MPSRNFGGGYSKGGTQMNDRRFIPICLGLGLAAFGVQFASAGEIFDPVVDTGTTENVGAVVLGGTVQGDVGTGTADRWVGQFFANTNECLRVAVTSQGTDLETVVISPNGTFYRNDDSGLAACPLCPVVKVQPAINGWYTVSIGSFNGTPTFANFHVAYGRYNNGNPNCASPTTPQVAAEKMRKSAGATSPAPENGPSE
jgi:hypothetical protein